MIQLLNQGKTSLHISKIIHRDHRTVKNYIANSNKVRQRSDKGTFRKISHAPGNQFYKESYCKKPPLNKLQDIC